MSIFTVTVNFPKDEVSKTFLQDTCSVIGAAFDQDPYCVMGKLSANARMSWRGSDERTAFVAIQTICFLDKDINQRCTKMVTDFVHKALDVKPDRVIVLFTEEVPADLSIGGTSLHQFN